MVNCPLCQQSKHMHKGKDLYGKRVCKKCLKKFAGRRQFAFAIDSILLRVVAAVAGALILPLLLSASAPPSDGALFLTSFLMVGLPLGLIFALKDGFSGRSLGKAICGVQVRNDDDYTPAGFMASFKRNLCLLIPFIVFVIMVQMFKGKRLGDKWAKTRVIWTKYADNPVFTGAELPADVAEFDEVGGRQDYTSSDNPFQAPLE